MKAFKCRTPSIQCCLPAHNRSHKAIILIVLIVAGIAGCRKHVAHPPARNPQQQALFQEAQNLTAQLRYAEAEKTFQKLLVASPNDAQARSDLAEIYSNEGRENDAAAEYQEILRVNPKYDKANLGLAYAFMRQGKLQEAERIMLEVLSRRPKDAFAHARLGMIYLREAKRNDAKVGMAYFEEAKRNIDKQKVEEGIEQYQQCLLADPNFFEGHVGLGYAYMELGDWNKAEVEFKLAVKVKRYFDSYKGLAMVYEHEGKTKEAIEAYQHALQYPFPKIYADQIKERLQMLQSSVTK